MDLELAVNFTAPSGLTHNLLYGVGLVSTSNVGTPEEQADYMILSTFPTTRFDVDGISYTLTLGFENLQGGGFLQSGNRLYALESTSATADLMATVTTAVPEPTTMIAGALLLLPFGWQGVRFLRNRKQVA